MKFRQWSPLLLLFCIVSAAYVNSFHGKFQFDDYNVIIENYKVHSWSAWLSNAVSIRPLLKLTYTFNWISGAGIFGFHLFNLAIHITNAILIYFISLRFSLQNGLSPAGNIAFAAALLFAVHPVQTEAVTYISGRSASLEAMFYLGSLLAYISGVNLNKRFMLYLVSPLLFVMAFLTKEVAVTLPLALILWDAACIPGNRLKDSIKREAVHWILLFIILSAFIFNTGYFSLIEFGFESRSLKDNLLSQINGITYLMSRLFAVNSLNIDPDLPVISAWTPHLAAQASLLSILIIAALVCFRRRLWFGFGILWFFLHLIPTNTVIPRLDIANERHLYLPVWGIFLAVSIEFERIREKLKKGKFIQIAGAIILCMLLIFFTISRNSVYKSEIALWEDTVLKSQEKPRVYNNLGYAYALAGFDEKAKAAYLAALSLKPDYKKARNNLDFLLRKGMIK